DPVTLQAEGRVVLSDHQAASRPARHRRGSPCCRRARAAFRADARCDRLAGECPPVEPRPSRQAVIHADTSFLVDLLRDATRGIRGLATALLEEITREEIRVG